MSPSLLNSTSLLARSRATEKTLWDFGARGDARDLTDVAITSGSTTLTSATGAFTSSDTGKVITVAGAGASGAGLITTISSVTNSTTIVLAAAAGTTVSGANAVLGTDDTTAIQNAINSTPAGGKLRIPPAAFLTTATLTLPNNITLVGGGVHEILGSVATSTITLNAPPSPPYLTGSVIVVAALGINGIALGGAGVVVHASDFGVRFAPGVAYKSTGHGFYLKYGTPPSGGSDNGLMWSHWDNVVVWGHDGNHYAFYYVNLINCTFDHLRSYGGGGFYVNCDSFYGNYGNSVFNHPYSALYAGGTANAFTLTGRLVDGNTSGVLNLLQFNRPQGIALAMGPTFGATQATSSQYNWYMDDLVAHTSVVAPDFETSTVVNAQTRFGARARFVDPSGLLGTSSFLRFLFPTKTLNRSLNSDMQFAGAGPATSATLQAGLGTSPPSATLGSGQAAADDNRGTVSLGTGTSPAAGALVKINWSATKGALQAPIITPGNAATAALGLYISTNDTTGFTVSATNAPAASQAAGTYVFTYMAAA